MPEDLSAIPGYTAENPMRISAEMAKLLDPATIALIKKDTPFVEIDE